MSDKEKKILRARPIPINIIIYNMHQVFEMRMCIFSLFV